jgi:hypothetical protein
MRDRGDGVNTMCRDSSPNTPRDCPVVFTAVSLSAWWLTLLKE